MNTELRKKATNNFEKDLFKLLNNSFFGKTIQNQRNQIDVKIVLDENHVKKLINKPHFKTFKILNEDKALVSMNKINVKLNRPIYIGFTVLELSKLLMFDSYYNCFKKHYQDNLRLCYSDTDSFVFSIETEDIYRDFNTVFSDKMDLSNYPLNHPIFDNRFEKEIGKFKDEMGGKIITEFIALKAKLYSVAFEKNQEKVTAKGVQRSVIKKSIHHSHYKKCLLENEIFATNSRRIMSKSHEIKTIKQSKMVFTPFDDKKFILDNGIDSLPFGHYSLTV